MWGGYSPSMVPNIGQTGFLRSKGYHKVYDLVMALQTKQLQTTCGVSVSFSSPFHLSLWNYMGAWMAVMIDSRKKGGWTHGQQTEGRQRKHSGAEWIHTCPPPSGKSCTILVPCRALTPAAPPPLYAVAQSPEFVRQYPAGKGGRGGILILQIIFGSGE